MAQSTLSSNSVEALELYKTPPHSIETEQSVLGGLMLDNQAWDKIADIITDDDFYRHDHRLIYHHICKLIEQNKPADVVTVAESLESSAELQSVGGLSYIGSIVQNTPSAANIKRYAEIVRERSIMRNLAQIGVQITDSAFNPAGRSAADLLDEAESRVFEIAEEGARGKQGFIEYFNEMAKEYPNKEIEFVRAVAEGNLVALHTHQVWPGGDEYVTMDFFRFDENGKIVEHWDSIQQVPRGTKSGNPMY